jgi:hypothetical protein
VVTAKAVTLAGRLVVLNPPERHQPTQKNLPPRSDQSVFLAVARLRPWVGPVIG